MRGVYYRLIKEEVKCAAMREYQQEYFLKLYHNMDERMKRKLCQEQRPKLCLERNHLLLQQFSALLLPVKMHVKAQKNKYRHLFAQRLHTVARSQDQGLTKYLQATSRISLHNCVNK